MDMVSRNTCGTSTSVPLGRTTDGPMPILAENNMNIDAAERFAELAFGGSIRRWPACR